MDDNITGIMSIAKGERGEKGDKGDSYVITGSDYQEIAEVVKGDGEISRLSDGMQTLFGDLYDVSDISLFPLFYGTITNTSTWNINGTNHQFRAVNIEKTGCKLTMTAPESRSIYYAGLKSMIEVQPENGQSITPEMYSSDEEWTSKRLLNADSTVSIDIPDDVRCIVIVVKQSGNDRTPVSFNIHKDGSGEIQSIQNRVTALETTVERITKPVRWCAMGDSITAGHVSFISAVTSKPITSKIPEKAWVHKMSVINGWNVTNLGIGGTGWNKATNEEVSVGVDTTSAHKVAAVTDFKQFDLVTLAYGINDWKGNRKTGAITDQYQIPESTIAGMRKTIETILESNPLIKIIVITPLNCAGYTSAITEDFEYADDDGWALGHQYSQSGTLEQFTQKLIEVCKWYGIQYIDQTHESCVNRVNIRSCLTDGVHPNEETYTVLAEELSGKIAFKC